MKKKILLLASILGFFSVLLGALGSHFLEAHLVSLDRVDTFESAVRYQFYHVLLLFIIGLLYNQENFLKYSFYFTFYGIILFSGSLYLLSLTDISFYGMITPIGGLLLLFGWFFIILNFFLNNK
tara:strand:- start:3145 stop:3516 length:372 start_codon:yes stop_codon:yes gene_type:complete